MRLTIVQYGGDYREAVRRFAGGGKATYQAQRYSVSFVGSLAERLEQVAVVCATSDEPYDEILGNGVRGVGAGLKPGFAPRDLLPFVAGTRPDRLVITTPMRPLLGWARRNGVRSIAVLADSFARKAPRDRLRAWLLARHFNGGTVEWVGNHGLNSCLSLLDIGVDPAKIVPWDWPPSFTPHDNAPRARGEGPLKLAYVGGVFEAKGVGDLLEAVALLRGRGLATILHIYGPDAEGAMQRKAEAMALGDCTTFVGPIPNEDVPEAMRCADVVVVPSRHEYPEGLPLTIYEALSARTPILASDHPMFRGALTDGVSARIFRASDPESLAEGIKQLATDGDLYQALSANSAAAWEALQLPVAWGDLMSRWLADGEGDRHWLADHSVASGRYDARLEERRRAMRATGARN